jgi:hypothetical protein
MTTGAVESYYEVQIEFLHECFLGLATNVGCPRDKILHFEPLHTDSSVVLVGFVD